MRIVLYGCGKRLVTAFHLVAVNVAHGIRLRTAGLECHVKHRMEYSKFVISNRWDEELAKGERAITDVRYVVIFLPLKRACPPSVINDPT